MNNMTLFEVAVTIISVLVVYAASVYIGLYLAVWTYKQISGNRITPAGDKISEEGGDDHGEEQ